MNSSIISTNTQGLLEQHFPSKLTSTVLDCGYIVVTITLFSRGKKDPHINLITYLRKRLSLFTKLILVHTSVNEIISESKTTGVPP